MEGHRGYPVTKAIRNVLVRMAPESLRKKFSSGSPMQSRAKCKRACHRPWLAEKNGNNGVLM